MRLTLRERISNAVKAWRFGATENLISIDSQFKQLADMRSPIGDFVQSSTAVYSAIDLRSTTLAAIPIKLLQKTESGFERVTDHPVLELLKFVNPYWTFERLLQAVEMSMCVFGEAFIVIERDSRGNPAELWFVPANRIKLAERKADSDYIPGYVVEVGIGDRIPYAAEDVIWVRGVMDPTNEFRCISPLRAARLAVESSIDAMVSNHSIFKNGLNVGGILTQENQAQP